jgi:PadR family transcriptional regulator, regulatory protein PadR
MPQRITKPTLRLLEIFLADPRRSWYGLELMDRAELKSGTVYPILHRLTTDGWLAVRQEEIDPAVEGRPQRRLYVLTGVGEIGAQRELQLRAQPLLRPVPRLGSARG